ncbi:MAG: 4Fe-4S ferredoxin [Spirochaetes bacterium GWD1_27_9]|nr:MAG: 4Fe-4S ferredoxin [Spirochaetes bacterium GWB1_27_13]OHD21962.1 MAG: 4Fe-4S ferredoxin [Spirochaetes bacterium GWC1_27_15]OHD43589.1 MAG: 4Fe-4S ferredoxin [Spirochaetes bacterium GWD1_27_9]
MSNVYFTSVNNKTTVKEVNLISQKLLETVIEKENIQLEKEIPLKVHFGEQGNHTYIKPDNYNGIIEFLENKNIKTSFMETSVLYGGQRYKKELHLKTAKEHGFTRVPVIIADGDHGEDFYEVEINKTHYKKCKLGKEFSKYNQIIVVAHFKGHMLAGFGGAMKQLSMGYAAKGGKLAMHMGIKPRILNRKCKQCHLCQKKCQVDAITIGNKSFINQDICIGCGACVAICPHKAVSIITIGAIFKAIFGNRFDEKLVEYAYAAQKDKKNIYLNFLMSITQGCDCEGKKMSPIMEDIGIFASTDPVAIDKACYDLVKKGGKKLKGHSMFHHAEKIGLGSQHYVLKEV